MLEDGQKQDYMRGLAVEQVKTNEKYEKILYNILEYEKDLDDDEGWEVKDIDILFSGHIQTLKAYGLIETIYDSNSYTLYHTTNERYITGVIEEARRERQKEGEEETEDTSDLVKPTPQFDLEVDDDIIEEFENIDDPLSFWAQRVNPKVENMLEVKKAVVLSLASATDRYGDRGRIHTLLEGDAGTGKSTITKWCVHQLGCEGASQRSTKAGLTGDMSGREITPGALPKADGGVICIDELDDFANDDRQGCLEAMSEGEIELQGGGDEKVFKARVRVIANANRVENFSPELLDRFDFHFKLETPSKDDKKEIMEKIVDDWFKEKEGYAGRELRQYLNWIKDYLPDLSDESREVIKEFYKMFIREDKKDRGIRHHEGIMRVGHTIAKMGKREFLPKDFIRGLILMYPEMRDVLIKEIEENGLTEEQKRCIIRGFRYEMKEEEYEHLESALKGQGLGQILDEEL